MSDLVAACTCNFSQFSFSNPSRYFSGGHWGTFILTSEEMTEPPKRLLAATKAKGLKEGEFGVCEIGETVFGVPRKV